MPPRPVTDDERAQIIAYVRDGNSRNDTARHFKRSPSTISRIAHAAGLNFDRSKTKAATEAKQADNRERRAKITETMLDQIEQLQEQMFAPTLTFKIGGRDNVYTEHTLEQPTFADKRDLSYSIKNFMGVVLDTERIDQPSAGHGALEELVSAIKRAREG